MFASGQLFLTFLSPDCLSLSGTHRGVIADSSTTGRQHASTTFGLWQSHVQIQCIPTPIHNSDNPAGFALQQPQALFSSVASDFLSLQGTPLK